MHHAPLRLDCTTSPSPPPKEKQREEATISRSRRHASGKRDLGKAKGKESAEGRASAEIGRRATERKRRERRKGLKDAALKTKESAGIQKRKVREKDQNKIVKGVRVGNTKIRKNVSYGGIIIKDSASKQAVLDMLKAEDRMM